MVTIKIDFFVWETISAFRAIQRYFELIEFQIEKVKDEKRQRLRELPVPRDEEEYQTEYLPTVCAHKHEFEKLLPRIVGYSFIMMLFSELEFRLNEITREINKRDNISKNMSDFKGDLVKKFCKFLKVANKPQMNIAEKTRINEFKVVRNCIVHNNGFLNNFKKSEQVRNIAKNKPHIEIVGKPAFERIQVTSSM